MGWGHRTTLKENNLGAGWVGGATAYLVSGLEVPLLIWWVVPLLIWEVATAYLSKGILDPTLALIRAQLGFRIQVRAECGNMLGVTIPAISVSFLTSFLR